MRKNRAATIALAVLLIILVVGVVGLAGAPIKPPVHTVEQTVPDDHIPR